MVARVGVRSDRACWNNESRTCVILRSFQSPRQFYYRGERGLLGLGLHKTNPSCFCFCRLYVQTTLCRVELARAHAANDNNDGSPSEMADLSRG